MLVHDSYLSEAVLGSFDDSLNTPPDGSVTPPITPPMAPPVHTEPSLKPTQMSPDGRPLFSQDQLNAILAEDKRKHQAVLVKTEQQYKDLLSNSQSLTTKERETLQANLEQVSAQLRTREAQSAHEKQQIEERYTKAVKEADAKASTWETKYRETTIARSLQDAAVVNGAYRSEQIVTILRPMTKLIEVVDDRTGQSTGQYRPVVEFPDKNPTTGEPMLASFSPEEAVKRMQELPEVYGNLFKNNVVSGIGSNSTTGFTPGSNGRIDVKKLTPEQYREVRAKNPELLGLRPRRR